MAQSYNFTRSWFSNTTQQIWAQILQQNQPRRVLEIGSFEGASTCYLVETLAAQHDIELHCVDTWQGSLENQAGGGAEADMAAVEARFHHNIALAIHKAKHKTDLVVHKKLSDEALAEMIVAGKKNYFDFIYIDGSHQAPDVLCDATMAFKLLKVGGLMIFDDYLWAENLPYGRDPLRTPKPAIDAFVNLNIRKVNIVQALLYQLYLIKTAD